MSAWKTSANDDKAQTYTNLAKYGKRKITTHSSQQAQGRINGQETSAKRMLQKNNPKLFHREERVRSLDQAGGGGHQAPAAQRRGSSNQSRVPDQSRLRPGSALLPPNRVSVRMSIRSDSFVWGRANSNPGTHIRTQGHK